MSLDLPATGTPPPRTTSIINRIVASALRQRFFVILMTILLIGAGSWALRAPAGGRLSGSLAAQGRDHHAMARTRRRGSGTADHGIHRTGHDRNSAKTTSIRSISLYGLSDVVLTFENDTDNYFARQEVFNRLGDLSLPSGVTPSVSPLTSPSGLIYRYVLQSPDRSPMELKTFEDWIVEPQYRSVPGVADDSGFGGGTMQYQVLLDPARVAGVGLSVLQVESALAANNSNAGGGFYSQGGQFYLRARRRTRGDGGGHRQRSAGGT